MVAIRRTSFFVIASIPPMQAAYRFCPSMVTRAKDALARAESALENTSLSKEERRVREAAKRRAQVRISVAENHK